MGCRAERRLRLPVSLLATFRLRQRHQAPNFSHSLGMFWSLSLSVSLCLSLSVCHPQGPRPLGTLEPSTGGSPHTNLWALFVPTVPGWLTSILWSLVSITRTRTYFGLFGVQGLLKMYQKWPTPLSSRPASGVGFKG